MGPLLALLMQNPGFLSAAGGSSAEAGPLAGLLGGDKGPGIDIFKHLPLPEIPDMPYGWQGGSSPLSLLTSRR